MNQEGLVIFHLLGPVRLGSEAVIPCPASPTSLGILAALMLAGRHGLSASRLKRLIWDNPPRSAMSNLRTYIGQARTHLREYGLTDRLHTNRGTGGADATYQLFIESGESDVQAFNEHTSQAGVASARGQFDVAMHRLRQGLSLWAGPACSNASGSTVMRGYIYALNEQRLLAREDYIEAGLALGLAHVLVGEARAVVADHPTRERASEQLIRVLYASGDPHGALNEHRRLSMRLREDLGVDPSPALQRLYSAILSHDESLQRRKDPQILGWSA
ncbi:AfsR/SARP family transcriptional regulator [Nonomuraea sp. NPDC001023]|uniref:AfsR/SARP family transcriptional regulator n=1 Tax=unclassified Nonomuraea TaxID=2593643 RepID=UPI003323BDC4